MSKQIPLSQNKFATVDDQDYDWLSRHKWSYDPKGYAARSVRSDNGRYTVLYMHRAILNASGPCVVDHIDADGLNNQRSNLRITTVAQNVYNARPQKKTSNYKGVSIHRQTNLWQASIKKGSTRIFLGLFENEEAAARMYNAAARYLFGEHAFTNDVANDTLTADDLPQSIKTSSYRGVHMDTESGRWKSQIQISKKKLFLGYFDSEAAAAMAYDAAIVTHGLRRRLNFPQPTTTPADP